MKIRTPSVTPQIAKGKQRKMIMKKETMTIEQKGDNDDDDEDEGENDEGENDEEHKGDQDGEWAGDDMQAPPRVKSEHS